MIQTPTGIVRPHQGKQSRTAVFGLWRRALTIGALAAGLAGCGRVEKPTFPSASIEGEVTLDGTAVSTGSLQFVPPADVRGQVAQTKIVNGKYKAQDVALGKVRVMFNITRETGKMITEYSTPYPEVENLVPPQYRDGVELIVTGDDKHAFHLTTKSDDAK